METLVLCPYSINYQILDILAPIIQILLSKI